VNAGDAWLAWNLQDIRDRVGSAGVVIVTWDEDVQAAGDGGQIPTFIVPGTGATLAGCATSCQRTPYDQASTLRAIVNTFGLTCSSLDTKGAGRCTTAVPLPIQLA
jgi:hypothetical protein